MFLKPSQLHFFHLEQFSKFDSLPQTTSVLMKLYFSGKNTPFVQNISSQHSFHFTVDSDTDYEVDFPDWVGLNSFPSNKLLC